MDEYTEYFETREQYQKLVVDEMQFESIEAFERETGATFDILKGKHWYVNHNRVCARDEPEDDNHLWDVFYMVRNHDVADDEESRFDEDDEYMDQLPDPIRLMCKTAIGEMGSTLLAIQIYCVYWLRQVHDYDAVRAEFAKWSKDWLDGMGDGSEEEKTDPDFLEMLASEAKCCEAWLATALEWMYWR